MDLIAFEYPGFFPFFLHTKILGNQPEYTIKSSIVTNTESVHYLYLFVDLNYKFSSKM